ncbi:hypothetical protein ABH920_003320 [Catenulispora sp. EB89]|uniref:hypothetical protein n=1 Tax=Catenulispora sp. EB89 TaxID=3156257 RepID=UPI00351406DF
MIFESRLELARLLFADFDLGVSRILAQPFLMTATVDGMQRRQLGREGAVLLLHETGDVKKGC